MKDWFKRQWEKFTYWWNERKLLRELVSEYEKDLISSAKTIGELGKFNSDMSIALDKANRALLEAAENVQKERKQTAQKIKSLEIRNALLESRVK